MKRWVRIMSSHCQTPTFRKNKGLNQQMELGTCDLINPDMAPGQYTCLTVADTGTGLVFYKKSKFFDRLKYYGFVQNVSYSFGNCGH